MRTEEGAPSLPVRIQKKFFRRSIANVVRVYGDQAIPNADISTSLADRGTITAQQSDLIGVLHNLLEE